ncbi:MAG: hypothetical protein FJZ56_06980 [Chlamydiae bacterium]|nr:hypothetical protein [Chlamydiota bacterium]
MITATQNTNSNDRQEISLFLNEQIEKIELNHIDWVNKEVKTLLTAWNETKHHKPSFLEMGCLVHKILTLYHKITLQSTLDLPSIKLLKKQAEALEAALCKKTFAKLYYAEIMQKNREFSNLSSNPDRIKLESYKTYQEAADVLGIQDSLVPIEKEQIEQDLSIANILSDLEGELQKLQSTLEKENYLQTYPIFYQKFSDFFAKLQSGSLTIPRRHTEIWQSIKKKNGDCASTYKNYIEVNRNHLFSSSKRHARIALYSHNQYNFQNGVTKASCAGIATACLERLLFNPDHFFDQPRTFESVLLKGRSYYLEGLNSLNQETESNSSEFLKPAFIQGGKNRIYERYPDLNNARAENQIDRLSAADVASTRQISAKELIIDFIIGGLEAAFRTFENYNLPFDAQKIINDLKTELESDTHSLEERNLGAIYDALQGVILDSITLRKPDGYFLNFNEGASIIADRSMIKIRENSIAVNPDLIYPEEHYAALLEQMSSEVDKSGSAIGAILLIHSFFFSISMNIDKTVMIADSHGIRYAKNGWGGSPYAVIKAANIEEAASLLAHHLPISVPTAEDRLNDENNSTYYLYKLRPDVVFSEEPVEKVSLERALEPFNAKKISSPKLIQDSILSSAAEKKEDDAVLKDALTFITNQPDAWDALKSALKSKTLKVNQKIILQNLIQEARINPIDVLEKYIRVYNQAKKIPDDLRQVYNKSGLDGVVENIKNSKYSLSMKAVETLFKPLVNNKRQFLRMAYIAVYLPQ